MTEKFEDLLRREIESSVRECMGTEQDDVSWGLVDSFAPAQRMPWYRRFIDRMSLRAHRARQAWGVLRGSLEVYEDDD